MKRLLYLTGWCEHHGEVSHLSRKGARAYAKRYPQSKGMREYPCEVWQGLWHLGHLPAVVKRGEMTQREVYGR